jgi:hypothetical protein
VGQGEGTGAGDADPEFELCYLDADGGERRELPAHYFNPLSSGPGRAGPGVLGKVAPFADGTCGKGGSGP